jgi:hypothetical protein
MIRGDQTADLDDLVLACRSETARHAFSEAVACFRAGAYRAAIVTTWTAIVYDYLAKLRDLELAGNGQATMILQSVEKARQENDHKRLLLFEHGVLEEAATKFDLLTPIEKEDLERIQKDRNRCAHPSEIAIEDPYRPAAEVARAHMRNAVMHLLSRPPLQGKEAWLRIWGDVTSDLFPDEHEAALERLRVRMPRARATLVNQLVVEVTKVFFDPRHDRSANDRYFAALSAVSTLYPHEVDLVLAQKLPGLADGVEEHRLGLLLVYVAGVERAWSALGGLGQQKLHAFVKSSTSSGDLARASRVQDLWSTVTARIKAIDARTLAELCKRTQKPECREEIVRRFEEGPSSYKTIAILRDAWKAVEGQFNWPQPLVGRLVKLLSSNGGLMNYWGWADLAVEVLHISGAGALAFESDWRAIHDGVARDEKTHYARDAIRGVFPSFATMSPG